MRLYSDKTQPFILARSAYRSHAPITEFAACFFVIPLSRYNFEASATPFHMIP